jgi:hypothetical protein
VASNLKKTRWRPELRWSLQRSTVAFTGYGATMVTGELLLLSTTWWKGHGVAWSRRTTYTSMTAAWPRRRQVDEATERPHCSNFIHGEIFSPGVVIRVLLGANRSAGANPSARVTGGEVHCICWSFSVLYHGDHHQSIWQSKLEALVLQFLCGNLLICL